MGAKLGLVTESIFVTFIKKHNVFLSQERKIVIIFVMNICGAKPQ